MPSFKNIFRYMRTYGVKSTLGLIREKLIVDPKRFSPKKTRVLPEFPEGYSAGVLPGDAPARSGFTVMYALHYFYPDKKGGTERFTLNIAKEAKRCLNKVKILVLDANRPESDYTERCGDILYRRYEYEGIECIGFRYKKAPLGLYYKRISTEDESLSAFTRFLIENEGISLVHATYPQPFAPMLAECKKMGVPYVVTCTDFAACCHYSTMVDDNGDFCPGSECGERCKRICPTYGCSDFAGRREAAKEMLLGAEYVTVPSKFVARVLSCEFPEVKFIPVNHGISDAFTKPFKKREIKKFVYAGTISRLKGIHLLTDAFSRLEGDGLSLDIYGSGDGKYLEALKKNADPRIVFHDAVDGGMMPEIYASADCVVVPSMWYETYNFVLREAAESGALVIAADIGAMSEAVKVGKNGFLFRAGDADDLYEKLCLAVSFDQDSYERVSYPKLSDEGDVYDLIYRDCLKDKLMF
jgi:glycosyltransferase involved in cell wall biosynthesis